ncbi:MAG: exosome complex RNA-binding protein Csl4 [Candidatus Thorarchaeota archaeon]|jgi:exosome complex component CSL4
MADVKSGDIVVPGDQLCVIEELTPDFGTYERDGVVYAATSGGVAIDLKARSIRVLAADGTMKLALPVKGDILMGEVINAYEQRAEVTIVKRNGKDVYSPFVGEIHISNVTRRFVRSMGNVIRQGDVVRGTALNSHEIPVEISLVGPELGVVRAKCVKCGNDLTLTSNNNMFCLRCENRETREVARDYGVMFGIEPRKDLAPRRRSYDDRRRDSGPRSYDRRDRRSGPRRYGEGGSDRDRGGRGRGRRQQ